MDSEKETQENKKITESKTTQDQCVNADCKEKN